ncbi:MAG: hypothetical protein Kow0013_03490 [Pararhodobacter sp.]
MSTLLMLSPAPIREVVAGEVVLDVKFVEGMKLHCQLWPGRVRCILWRGNAQIDDPMRYATARLGFELVVLDKGAPVPDLMFDDCALVYCAADDMKHLDLPDIMRGRIGKTVFTVDQALGGRIGDALARDAPLRRKLGSALWNLNKERALRRALAEADGIHCNGYPAYRRYSRLNRHALNYLDNRIRTPMLARNAEQEARAAYLRSGAPLRLAWYGALTPESGVLDLLPVAYLLTLRGCAFTLDLFGAGPCRSRLQDGIDGLGLSRSVRLSEPPGFEARLVPYLRKNADLFLSPRRLPTPLSSYVEALGCGLPIVGYNNAMWRALQRHSRAGWIVRSGGIGAMARTIQKLDTDREALIAASGRAVEFARANSFETVFARRMNDLREIADRNDLLND